MKLTKLFFFVIFCNLIFNIVVGIDVRPNTVPPTPGWLPSKVDIDRSEIPKNILLGVNVGGWSHFRHILTIANILADRGYNITLTARGNFSQSSQYPKINFISLGEIYNFQDDPKFKKLVLDKLDLSRFKTVFDRHHEFYNDALSKFKEVSEMVKPDLFFCDTLNNEPCYDVAWLMKKPLVGISTTVLGLTHAHYRSDPVFGCKVSMENESLWERFKCGIISPLKLVWYLRPSINNFNKLRVSNGLPTLSNPFERWQGSLFLVDTFFGFEIPVPLPPLYQEIGPVLPDYYPPLTPDLEKFIESHKRTMFIALGTFLYLSRENNAKLLQSIVESIENNIVDGVIWANIKNNQEAFPPNITLSDGRIIYTMDIFNNKYPNIHMASYAPQFAILNHTNTKLFLSHSGSGSTYESLFTGTPVLALPITFDQPGNAEKLVLAGVALQLDKLDLNVNDILEKIEKIQKDEKIQINVKRLKTLAIINSDRKYRAADLIEFVLYSSTLKQKNDDDDEIEKWIFKDFITPDTRMGFIRGNYLDVYIITFTILISILSGFIWGFIIIGKMIFRKLFKNVEEESKEKEE